MVRPSLGSTCLVLGLAACGGSGASSSAPPGAADGASGNVDLGECTTRTLPFYVLDADYSTSLDRIVVLSTGPSVVLVDPSTASTLMIPLPAMGASLSLAPDGRSAAVAHDHAVSIVDLAQQTPTANIPTTTDAGDIVMGGNGFAYVFPHGGGNSSIRVDVHSIEIAKAVDHGNDSMGQLDVGTLAKLHPSGSWIYGSILTVSPGALERNNLTAGIANGFAFQRDQGDGSVCGDLWLSADGLDAFTGCGTIYRLTPGTGNDMVYRASLQQVPSTRPVEALFQSISLVPDKDRIYALIGQQIGDPQAIPLEGQVGTFSYNSLDLLGTKAIPCIARDSQKHLAVGHYVFTSADHTKLYVLAQSPIDPIWGLATFALE